MVKWLEQGEAVYFDMDTMQLFTEADVDSIEKQLSFNEYIPTVPNHFLGDRLCYTSDDTGASIWFDNCFFKVSLLGGQGISINNKVVLRGNWLYINRIGWWSKGVLSIYFAGARIDLQKGGKVHVVHPRHIETFVKPEHRHRKDFVRSII